MSWLKYRHKFGHGKGSWEWRDLQADATEPDFADGVESICEELRDLYAHGEQYRGLDYEVIDDARVPDWVIAHAIEVNAIRFRDAENYARRLDDLRPKTKACPKCDGCERVDQLVPGVRVNDCPECGRSRVFCEPYPMLKRGRYNQESKPT